MDVDGDNGSNRRVIWYIVVTILVIVIVFVLIFAAGLLSSSSTVCSIDPPKNVQAESLGDNKVRFSWDEVPGADSYCIYLSTIANCSPDTHQFAVKTSTNPFIWELDAPGEYHYVMTSKRNICSGNKCGGCESKPTVKYVSMFNCDLPSAPVIFDDISGGITELFVAWFPLDNATKYNLYFKNQQGSPSIPSSSNFDTKITVDHPAYWYIFQVPPATGPWSVVVSSINDCGESEVSEPFTQVII